MKSILQEIIDNTRQQEKEEVEEATKIEIANTSTYNDRRSFLKKAALGGISLGGMMNLSIEHTIAQTSELTWLEN